jgi:transposase
VATHIFGARRKRRPASAHHDRQFGGQGASLGERRQKRGAQNQAIGRSRGGRTTKIHALVDEEGRPHAFLLTGGHVADVTGAATLLAATAPSEQMIGDKGYDADHLRLFLQARGTTPVIPNKVNRKRLFPFDAELYRLRNVIERTFCRLKDFRAIATRYDKTARNFLAGLCLVAALRYWIN